MHREKRPGRVNDEPLATFLGGMRFGTFNATMPLVRLEFFNHGIRLRSSSRLLQRLVPILVADFGEILNVQAVTGRLDSGIRIRSRDNGGSVIFWTGSANSTLSCFAKHGMNVLEDSARFHISDPEK